MKICTYILLALISWTTSIANAKDYIVPEGVTVLTEDQLMAKVIGNTFMGGIKWVEYYEPSIGGQKVGRIKGKHRRTGLYGGNWKIKESLMCWEHDDPKWAAYDDCFSIALDGDTVIRYTTRGIEHADIAGKLTLIPGNPNSL
jgi:hypothetical protein